MGYAIDALRDGLHLPRRRQLRARRRIRWAATSPACGSIRSSPSGWIISSSRRSAVRDRAGAPLVGAVRLSDPDVRALPLTFSAGSKRASDAISSSYNPARAQTRRAHHRRGRRDRPRPDRASRRASEPRHRHARRRAGSIPSIARKVDREITGSILDRGVLERVLAEFQVELDLSSGGPALDARRVHARGGAPGQRRRHAQPARIRAARGGVARPAGRLHVSVVDRRVRPAGPRHQDARGQGEGGRVGAPDDDVRLQQAVLRAARALLRAATTSSSRPSARADASISARCGSRG